MKKLLILLLFFACNKAFSQSFYIVNSSNQLIKVTVNGSNISQDYMGSCGAMGSIAVYKNTMFYSYSTSLGKGTINGNNLSNCTNLGTAPNTSSLTADKNGILYMATANIIYRIDPATMTVTTLGTMLYYATGDLIFYKNDLYMASGSGIVKVNLTDPSLSTLVIPSNITIYGLASVPFNSTQNKVYALAIVNSTTNIIELDLDSYQLGKTVGNLPYLVFDAASTVEDGSFVEVKIDDIKATADCNSARGTIKVICNNATGDYRYTLNNTTNATGIFPDLDPGTYHITVSVGSEKKETDFTIAQFTPVKPELDITSVNPKCNTPGQITLTAKSDYNLYYIKYNNQLFDFNHTFANLKAGSYQFYIYNLSGCLVDTQTILLTQEPCDIIIDKTTITEECSTPDKAQVSITASPGADVYTYQLNNETNTTGLFENVSAGNYTLKITSAGGGNKEIPVIIPDYKSLNPAVTVIKKDAICDLKGEVKFNLTVNSAQYKIAYNNATYPFDHTFNDLADGTYNFIFLKPDGCVLDKTAVTIEKQSCEVVLFPNAFSPNNDGINDIFRPSQNSKADNYKLNIYNRFGALLFTSKNSHIGWDGQFKGKLAPTGVYYWIANFINNEGKAILKDGYVTLIR